MHVEIDNVLMEGQVNLEKSGSEVFMMMRSRSAWDVHCRS